MTIRINGTNTTASPGITGTDTDTGLQFGTDEVSIVTGGTDRLNIGSSGDITIADGNLVVAAGHGIDFSANANAGGMTSELLDDYEEGTFTITFTDASTSTQLGTSGTSANVASYVRIGRVCTINIDFQTFTQPGVGRVDVSGSAPFPSARPTFLKAGGAMRGFIASAKDLNPVVVIAGEGKTDGGSSFYLHLADEGSVANGYDQTSDWDRDNNFNTPGLLISGSYIIAEGS